MSQFSIREEQDAFIVKLQRLIREDRQDQALQAIAELESTHQQLTTLESLARTVGTSTLQLRFDLAIATIIARPLTRELVRDLTRAVNLALESVTTGDLIRTRSIDLTRALVRAVDLARTLDPTRVSNARNLARTLDLAYGISHELDPDFAADLTILMKIVEVLIFLYSADWVPATIREQMNNNFHRKLADALDETLYLQRQNPSKVTETIAYVLQNLIANNLHHITLEGVVAVTPYTLANTVVPYLQSLSDFLHLHSQLTGSDFHALRIHHMHDALSKVEVTGVDVRVLISVLDFRKHGQEKRLHNIKINMADTARTERESEAEIRLTQLELNNPDQDRAYLQNLLAEAEQKMVAARKEALELEHQRIKVEQELNDYYAQKAHELIDKLSPSLEFEARIPLVIQLIEAMKGIAASDVTLRFGWHNTPRPATK